MSASISPAAVRSCMAEHVAFFLLHSSAAQLGRTLGIAASTVTRRGDELAHWPADDVATLLSLSPDFARALAAVLVPQPPADGQAPLASTALLDQTAKLGQCVAAAAEALADRRISAAEATALRKRFEDLMVDVHTKVLPSLRQVEAGK